MKNDKFCVSKTLAYLVALVVAVVGAFYVMNYVNGQKVTTDSEAAGKTCKELGGDWYRDASCSALATRMRTRFSTVTSPKDAAYWNKFVCCKGEKEFTPTPVPAGYQTCKQQGGDWYRDATPAALKTKLEKESRGNTATVTEITTKLTDKSLYPTRHCYKVAYTYLQAGTQTCKQAGGSGYFFDSTPSALKTRLDKDARGYASVVTTVSGPFIDQIRNKYCYNVSYTEVADTTCQGQGGTWFGYTSCSEAEKAWDPNGVTSDVISNPSFAPTDTRTGSVCCVRK